MTTKLDHALALAAKGFNVFPLTPGQKAPPLITGWPQKATSDPDTIAAWWRHWPEANIGIHCEGMIVIDVDPRKGGSESLSFLEMNYGLNQTLTTCTPTGGLHYFYGHGDNVSNTVSELGAGLDIRSTGGYVVAPGSTVAAGEYRFQSEEVIAAAPEWLVLKLGTTLPKTGTPAAPVADAPVDAFERARLWLEAQPPAVEGQGGDAHTYAVACGLRDRGVSAEQALTLLTGSWNATCSPPWTAGELGAKVRNAYNYAQNAPGGLSISAQDFPLIAEVATPLPTPRGKLLTLSGLAGSQAQGAGYLVKGLLNRQSAAVAYGAPGEGKTFIALDLAYHIAAGRAWMGRRVHPGLVLYLAFEGVGGMAKRAKALYLRSKEAGDNLPFYVEPATYNLRDKAERVALGQTIALLPAKPVLIVVDTLARAMRGGDENSAQDMGALMDAVTALSENTGACVLLVHHSGKTKSAGARGSSALLGAIDTELEVEGGRITPTKQRDIELCPALGFKLLPVLVGMDEDGDEVTSCVVEVAAVSAPNARVTGNTKRAFDVLCELRPNNAPVGDDEWYAACKAFGLQRGRLWDVKRALDKAALIDLLPDGTTQRRMQ